MRIDGLSQQPKITQSQQRSAPVRSKKDGERPGDVVEISKSAPDVGELSAQAKATPAENNPRIQEIRQRVQSGYYESRQVREQIADSLLASDGMREVVSDVAQMQTAKEQLAQVPDVREDRVDATRQRVDAGFYDTRQARQDTADSMLDELA